MNIDELKRLRENVRARIKEWYDKGYNAGELVDEFIHYEEEMIKLGWVNQSKRTKAIYLQKEFWLREENVKKGKPKYYTPPIKTIAKQEQISINESLKEEKYSINIAWTDYKNKWKNSTSNVIGIIEDYLKYFNINKIDEEFTDFTDREEYIYKYNYNSPKPQVDVLVKSIRYIIELNNNLDIDIYSEKIY